MTHLVIILPTAERDLDQIPFEILAHQHVISCGQDQIQQVPPNRNSNRCVDLSCFGFIDQSRQERAASATGALILTFKSPSKSRVPFLSQLRDRMNGRSSYCSIRDRFKTIPI